MKQNNCTGNYERYTPQLYVEAVRKAMYIDLDPASCELANSVVKADKYYTAEDDALTKAWHGRVFLNPPYKNGLIDKFVTHFLEQLSAGNVHTAILLVNNSTETKWFQSLCRHRNRAEGICLPNKRISFWGPDGIKKSPIQGQAFIYYGAYFKNNFVRVFKDLGTILTIER